MKRPSSWQIVLVAWLVLAMTPGATSAAGPASGPLWVWGMDGNFELGAPNGACNAGYPCNPTPANVPGLAAVIAAAGGADHSLAVTADGNLWAWGHDDKGQLGYVSTQSCSSGLPGQCGQSATQVPGIGGVTAIAGGDSWSLAVRNDGTLWSWGDDAMYELGYGTSHTCSPSGLACSFSAGQVPGMGGIVAVAAGQGHSLAIDGSGMLWAWGANNNSQLGYPTLNTLCSNLSGQCSPPTTVPGLNNVVSAAAGWSHSAAVKSDGSVWTWGTNDSGQLGYTPSQMCGSQPCATSARQVPGLSGFTSVAAGSSHTLGLRSDGTVWAWGANDAGQLVHGGGGLPEDEGRRLGWAIS